MNLVGLNGFKTAGKDTAYRLANEVAAEAHETTCRRGFADKLKAIAALSLSFEEAEADLIDSMNILKESGYVETTWFVPASFSGTLIPQRLREEGRDYLKNLGNFARVVFGDSFWVDQVLPGGPAYVCDLPGRFDHADWGFITDVRYPNEAQRVLDLGGEVWEIERPGLESDGHVSEQPLPRELVTATILNDSSFGILKVRVMEQMELYGQRD